MSRRTRRRFIPCEHNGQACKPPSDIAYESTEEDPDEEDEDTCSCRITQSPDGAIYAYCRHCRVHGDSVR